MSVEVHIVDGAISSNAQVPRPMSGVGAMLVFDGIVRPMEDGRDLVALEYQAYEPMASRELRLLGEDVVRRHGLIWLRCVHSRGRVGAGECSMRVTIWSAHRGEGLGAMAEFIERLKRDVPIWKKPIWI